MTSPTDHGAAAQEPGSGGPLANLTIVDLTQFLSGPYCTQILGDLGARVVKVESPQGDLAREIPPHFVDDSSLYFHAVNRNKKSVVLDLKTADGVRRLMRLIAEADVVIENFRPGVLARLGVSAAQARAADPSLIWCAISGFGQDGPYRDKPAYDMIVQALSGGMSLTGEPGRTAVRAGVPIGDLAAGLYAAVGVLAAVNRRHLTGEGEMVDISMLDCQAAMLTYQMAYHLHSGEVPGRQGSAHDSIPTYRSFRAGDGVEVVVTANTERMWQGLCRALRVDALIGDERFTTNRERFANRHVLWPLLEAAFAAGSAAQWVERLEAEQVPVGVVNTLDRVADDPQVRHRGMVLDLPLGERSVRVMGNPIRTEVSRREGHEPPPRLGADTAAVFSALEEAPEAADPAADGVPSS
ncbi:CaiB/BaiF CoA transferase family protein [Salinarimonas sp. NSM]|uniref:CaiB/BaiF CoA transferase family protein n=1 Tax=Salinarimonas sp. NSM TaxID=3458003 RepID=UPI004036ABF1